MKTEHSDGLAQRIQERATEIYQEIVSLRRDIHLHPELSYEEVRTTALISDYLLGLGITPELPLLETGVVGVIHGEHKSSKGNVVALRADIDALPLNEENLHGFCSLESGKMHACGHDMHTAMLLGAAKILVEMKEQLEGDVLLVFQPAEEKAPGGAKPFLDAGLFRQFKPSVIIGQHCFPNVETGKVALCKGSFMAAQLLSVSIVFPMLKQEKLRFAKGASWLLPMNCTLLLQGRGGMLRRLIKLQILYLLRLILLLQLSILSAESFHLMNLLLFP